MALKRPASAMGKPTLEFFSAWFCPYAQRAWIALEHHGVKHERIEGLVPDRPGEDFIGYVKHPRLLELNPKGLVPTLSEGADRPPIYESAICVEYIDEMACAGSEEHGPTLLPGTPNDRARLRLQGDWINRQCCSPFYQVLVRKDPDERKVAFEKLQQSLQELNDSAVMPYLAGETLTIADIMFIPWAHRIMVCKTLEFYRGPGFVLDPTATPKLTAWVDRVMALPAVKATLADPKALITTYKRYSDATAQSKVAEAVRQGSTADTV